MADGGKPVADGGLLVPDLRAKQGGGEVLLYLLGEFVDAGAVPGGRRLEQEDQPAPASQQAGEPQEFNRRILTRKDSRSSVHGVKVVGRIGQVLQFAEM